MRKTTLLCSFGIATLVALAAGAYALAAPRARPTTKPPNVALTARASSVHYSVTVRLLKHGQPLVLHISGGASRGRVAVHLRLGDLKLKDGTKLPGTRGAIMLSKPFLYEEAPGGLAVNGASWLRLSTTRMAPDSQALSSVRALTPSPLLHVVQESKLRPTQSLGWYVGIVSDADPVVQTALAKLGGGLVYGDLRIAVRVASDGLIRAVRLTGHTADRSTRFALHARLYGFGVPVAVVPPKPGTFMDQQLSQLRS